MVKITNFFAVAAFTGGDIRQLAGPIESLMIREPQAANHPAALQFGAGMESVTGLFL